MGVVNLPTLASSASSSSSSPEITCVYIIAHFSARYVDALSICFLRVRLFSVVVSMSSLGLDGLGCKVCTADSRTSLLCRRERPPSTTDRPNVSPCSPKRALSLFFLFFLHNQRVTSCEHATPCDSSRRRVSGVQAQRAKKKKHQQGASQGSANKGEEGS